MLLKQPLTMQGGTSEATAIPQVSVCKTCFKENDVSAIVVQGDRVANEPEDSSVGFQAGFSDFVPWEFLFREKNILEISS